MTQITEEIFFNIRSFLCMKFFILTHFVKHHFFDEKSIKIILNCVTGDVMTISKKK
jgi:hypothetical protein